MFHSLHSKPTGPATHFLFIGNSYTYRHDIPHMVRKLAALKDVNFEVDVQAHGGWNWDKHLHNPATLAAINKGNWDYVVLQEQSQSMGLDGQTLQEGSFAPAVGLINYVHQHAPNAKILFYNTWAHKDGDKQNCKNFPNVCTYEGMQQRIDANYLTLAAYTRSYLVPVGTSWRAMRMTHPEIELYDSDGSHPSAAGAYLVACTFYKTLFQGSVTGIKAIGVDDATATIVQTVVDNYVR